MSHVGTTCLSLAAAARPAEAAKHKHAVPLKALPSLESCGQKQQQQQCAAPRQQARRPPPLRRRVSCQAGAAAASATALLFAATTIYAFGLALLMAAAPRWGPTQRLASSIVPLLPLAVAYGVLLAWSWAPDTLQLILPGSLAEGLSGGLKPQFFPSLAGISLLFSRVATGASLWVHLLAANLFAARTAYLEGMELGFPTWHTIVLCMTFAPLGLASQLATRWAAGRRPGGAGGG